jgi:hypothetical protein
MLRNKSYNFIQPNYMFISKLHNTQYKFSGKEDLPQDDTAHAIKPSYKSTIEKLKEQLTPARLAAIGGTAIVGGLGVANFNETQYGLDFYAKKEGQVQAEELKPHARSKYFESQNLPESIAAKSAGEEIAKELCNNFALSQFTRIVVDGRSGSVVFLTKDLKGEYELSDAKAAKENVYTGDNQTDPVAVEDFGFAVEEKFKEKFNILEVDTSDYGTKIIIRYSLKK